MLMIHTASHWGVERTTEEVFCNKLQITRVGERENNEDGFRRNQRMNLVESEIYKR